MPSTEGDVADAELAAHLVGGGAGSVSLDRITAISVVESSVHVFNLETSDGWFTANGITRFGLLPKRESSDETWPPANLERVHQSTQVARAHLTSYPKSQKIP